MATQPLRLRRLGIDTRDEAVVFMRRDCPACLAEGFDAESRVAVRLGDRELIATLQVVAPALLSRGEASLSESAWARLHARDGDAISISHPAPVLSLAHVRAKIMGARLTGAAMTAIISDVAHGAYSEMELAAFVTACAARGLNRRETVALTRAMAGAGERITWDQRVVADKHAVGGLPGNRTSPIVVPIVAAAGLTIPKTSSRAITSPAGTADVMATLTEVDLDMATLRRVVDLEGGCLAWGGSMRLSPADDLLIRVERPLDLDPPGQLVASILSKKLAAGATHVVLDMPVGPTAKVRSLRAATQLARMLVHVGRRLGLEVLVVNSDGSQPVGRGIGPALEARDVLAVLQGASDAPEDLRERAVRLAGTVLSLAGGVSARQGARTARRLLDSGEAWRKFCAICEAQGGLRDPPRAPVTREILATTTGTIVRFDNRALARAAKLAGAPRSPAAGLDLKVRLGDVVERGEPLFVLHAQHRGELEYATQNLPRLGTPIVVEPT